MLNIIQPDIWLSRKMRPKVAAIAPVEIAPFIHDITASAPTAVIMKPFSTATQARTVVIMRVSCVIALR